MVKPSRAANTILAAWKWLGQARSLEGTLFSLLSCLQAVLCDPGSQLPALAVTHAGVGFSDAALLEEFILL